MKLKNYVLSIGLFYISATFSVQALDLNNEFSISGFADAQYRYTKEVASPGFLLNDAALYLKYAKPNIELFIDLPFNGTNAGDANFNFAASKAQAFILVRPIDRVEVRLGQFDVLYGFESNDSVNLSFSQGATLSSLFPTVHTGATVTGTHENFSVTAMASNPGDLGSTNGQNLAFGLQATFDWEDMFYLTAGYQGHNQPGMAGMESLFDVVTGFKYEMLSLDLQFDLQKVAGSNKGYQFLPHLVADLNDEVAIGLRGNWLRESADDGTGTILYQVIEVTGGVQFHPADMENLNLKTDYTWSGTEATNGATRVKEHAIGVAATYSF